VCGAFDAAFAKLLWPLVCCLALDFDPTNSELENDQNIPKLYLDAEVKVKRQGQDNVSKIYIHNVSGKKYTSVYIL